MEFYGNYYESGMTIHSKAGQDEFFGALIRYLFSGVVPEKWKSGEAEVAFQSVRPSREKQWNGRRNRKKRSNEAESNAEAKPKETESKPPGTDEADGKETGSNAEETEKKLVSYKANKLTSIVNPSIPPSEFPIRCLDALNRLLGATYSTMPTKCVHMLQRCADKYTLDDVEAMISYKRDEWRGTQYANGLTPNTLFSPDHFEQYIHQAKSQVKEVNEYAAYD